MECAAQKLKAFLDDLRDITDRDERSDYLIEIAGRFQDVPPEIATRPFPKDHLVPGCESQAYVWVKKEGPVNPKFYFAVENPQGIAAKALSVILDESLSGEDPELIRKVSEEMVYEIFGRNITMGRGHGLMSMVAMVKVLAKK